jgi:uncharacterized membrane protein YphA (DoxX/SURF4 family)
MKILVNISRVLVGCLFIFSGLVKAIDPKGLAYKMQEFFEVWASDGFMKGLMNTLSEHALPFSIFMITLEIFLGVALLIGWQKKTTAILLLLLTSFFTFLTAFVLFTGKIRACGCFGDCIPLTPTQTFTKDLILLGLIFLILFGLKYIQPLFKSLISFGIMAVTLLLTLFLQWYVLGHLPLKDCLPFKVGNNILELRKMPKDAVADKYSYSFVYKKNGVQKEFTTDMPDSTWEFVDRKQTLIQKGKNNVPLINDFSFTTESGTDTTEAILGQKGEYYLLFVKDQNFGDAEWSAIESYMASRQMSKPHFVITSQVNEIDKLFNKSRERLGVTIFSCDATALKTAARSNPTLYLMNGPVVKQKWGWADFDKVLK